MAKPKKTPKTTVSKVCPRAHFHRAGSFCKSCGRTTPE